MADEAMRDVLGALVTVALLSSGCGSTPPPMAVPTLVTAGQDLDEHSPRSLTKNCPLPQPFYDALSGLNLTPQQLTQPDLFITFAGDPNRLKWTDTLRRQAE